MFKKQVVSREELFDRAFPLVTGYTADDLRRQNLRLLFDVDLAGTQLRKESERFSAMKADVTHDNTTNIGGLLNRFRK